jgi:hypothetical protein
MPISRGFDYRFNARKWAGYDFDIARPERASAAFDFDN